MLKAYHSGYQEVGKNPYGMLAQSSIMSDEQLIKWAFGEVLEYMGLRMKGEALRDQVDMPTSIRVEIIKQGWDILVCLYPEKETEDAIS